MFYTNINAYEGERVRLYRSPNEIRRDIGDINIRIRAVDERLNVRKLLTELFTEYSVGDPENWVREFSRMLDDAKAGLEQLYSLRDGLEMLNRELEDTLWVLEGQ